jgi:hypothetical protein
MGLVRCADEPKPGCITSPAPFAVKLIEQSRSADCDATFGPADFNANPLVGLEVYYPRDAKGQPDYGKGSVALRTAQLQSLIEEYNVANMATDGTVLSIGAFTNGQADDSNFCTAPSTTTTHVVLPAIPEVPDDLSTPDVDESMPALDPVDITLTWSNVQVYVTAAIDGTQFQATMTDTRPTAAGGSCTVTYLALGLSAAVQCAIFDDNGDPAGTDPTLCSPFPDPGKMRFTNNGISPLAKQSCDTATGWCLLDGNSVPAVQ